MANIVICATCEYTQADFDKIKSNGGEPLIVNKCSMTGFYWVGDVLTLAKHEPSERKTWLVWRNNWKWNPEGDLKAMFSCDIDAYGLPEPYTYFSFFNMYAERTLIPVSTTNLFPTNI